MGIFENFRSGKKKEKGDSPQQEAIKPKEIKEEGGANEFPEEAASLAQAQKDQAGIDQSGADAARRKIEEAALAEEAGRIVTEALEDSNRMKELLGDLSHVGPELGSEKRIAIMRELVSSGKGKDLYKAILENNEMTAEILFGARGMKEGLKSMIPEMIGNGEEKRFIKFLQGLEGGDSVVREFATAIMDQMRNSGKLEEDGQSFLFGLGLGEADARELAEYYMSNTSWRDYKKDDPEYYGKTLENIVKKTMAIG